MIHHEYLICIYYFFHVMCDQYHSDLLLLSEFMNSPSNRVKHCSRLIHNDAFRFHCHDTGDCYSLFLSSGKLIRRMMPVFDHPNSFQTFFHSLPDLIRRNAQVLRTKPHIFFYYSANDLIVRILKYHSRRLSYIPKFIRITRILSIYPYGTFCWHQNCIQMLGKS